MPKGRKRPVHMSGGGRLAAGEHWVGARAVANSRSTEKVATKRIYKGPSTYGTMPGTVGRRPKPKMPGMGGAPMMRRGGSVKGRGK